MVIVILAMAMTGVFAGGADEKSGTDGSAEAVGYPRKDRMVIALTSMPDSLLPINNSNGMNNRVMLSIMETLWQAKREGGYEGRLAEKWEASEDGMTYTVYLRQGVKFHDGTDFNTTTMKEWYDIIKESASGKFFYSTYVEGLTIIDDYTLEYNLKVPLGDYFMNGLANYAMIFSTEAYKANGEDWLRKNPVGTGPYKLSKWSVDEVVLTANPDYWGGAPTKQKLVFKALPDASAAVLSAEAGEIDMLDYAPAASAKVIENNPKLDVRVVTAPSYQNGLIMVNLEAAPLENHALRKAIAHAIDREFVVDVATEGTGIPNAQVLAPTVSGYDPDYSGLAYDPDRAKELLAEAGYPGGQGLPELSLMIYDGLTKQAEIIQENMRSIGISLKVEIVELNTWFERARSGDFMMNMLPWGVGTVGAAHMYLFHSDSIGTRGNYGKYSNATVDELLNKAMQETDRSNMIGLMQEANRIITEDAAFINVYTPAEVFVVNKAWDTDRIIQYFIPGMNPYYY
jgi:peptide/nickel transport system substrate-binding protein